MMLNDNNVIGKSWGTLALDHLQQDIWRKYNCDSLLSNLSEEERGPPPPTHVLIH